MAKNDIPKATARRLPLYQRAFKNLEETNNEKISSAELSELLKIDSATIRRDFSYFGTLGRRGYGYDVSEMVEFFNKILSESEVSHVAIVGVGNLGEAILKENVRSEANTKITAGFDIKEEIINTVHNGIPIYSMDTLETQLPFLGIKTAILTVPADNAQEVAENLVAGGVEGILNFSPRRITVPEHVRVHSVDLTNELQILVYFMKNYQ